MQKGLTDAEILRMMRSSPSSPIQNPQVFAYGYCPDRLLCRDHEIGQVVDFLRPFDASRHLVVCGGSGSGKTVMARTLHRALLEGGYQSHYLPAINATEYTLVRRAALAVSGSEELERSKARAWESLLEASSERTTYLLIDDAEWNVWLGRAFQKLCSSGNFSLVFFTKNAVLDDLLGEGSVIRAGKVALHAYTAPEVEEILSYHLNDLGAVREGSVPRAVLGAVSAYVVKHGKSDCRYGLDILRTACTLLGNEIRDGGAEEGSFLSEAHVSAALEKVEVSASELDDLSNAILLALVSQDGGCDMSAVIKACLRIQRFGGGVVASRSSIWRHIWKMQEEGVVRIVGSPGRGNLKRVQLNPQADTMARALVDKYGEAHVTRMIRLMRGAP